MTVSMTHSSHTRLGNRVRALLPIGVVGAMLFSLHAPGNETSHVDGSIDSASASACVDSSYQSGPRRIEGVDYGCIALRDGRHVWIGTAGDVHAETVLLIHGLGSNAHWDWRNVIPDLSARFHVITLDLPGFGASQSLPDGYSFEGLAATLAEILDQERVQRAHIVGHSLGGALALYFAHAFPKRTDRLVLVDAAGVLLKSVYVHHISKITTPQVGIAGVDRVLSSFDSHINSLNRHITYRLENSFDFSAWLRENPAARRALLGRFTQTDAALGLIEHDFTPEIRETSAPTTIIWGRNDDVSPLRVGTLLSARMQNATLHVFDRVGHVPMNEASADFNQLLRNVLTDPVILGIAELSVEQRRDLRCENESGRTFSGTIGTLTLVNCRDARIENARLEKLSATNSSVTLERVTIEGDDVAMDVRNSYVTATALQVSSSGVALSADDSQLDLAGASIRAGTQGIQMGRPSAIFFSVSDMHAPEYSGDLHQIWGVRSRGMQAESR